MGDYRIRQQRWHEVMLSVGRKQTWHFQGNNLGYTEDLITGNCRRHLMRWIYHHLVNNKLLTRIEDLTQEQKLDIWSFVKDICKGKQVESIVMKELAMVFYTIEYFLNEKEIK